MAVRSFRERPLDLLYFIFFLIHIPAALCVDMQLFYPAHLVPAPLKGLLHFYFNLSGDPMMRGVFGLTGHESEWTWFWSLLAAEGFFSLPMFFIGALGLWYDRPRVYLPLLIYAVMTTTTLVPVLSLVLTIPEVAKGEAWDIYSRKIGPGHRIQLLMAHGPFALIPAIMSIDMAGRVSKLITRGERRESKMKTI